MCRRCEEELDRNANHYHDSDLYTVFTPYCRVINTPEEQLKKCFGIDIIDVKSKYTEVSPVKVGDVVQLISSGPDMTVNVVYEFKDEVDCIWWNSTQLKYECGTFNIGTLRFSGKQ